MKGLKENDLIGLVVDWVENNSQNPDETNGGIEAGADLLSSGILDSVGFVELLVFVEEKTGRELDISEIDPEQFGTIGALCKYAIATV